MYSLNDEYPPLDPSVLADFEVLKRTAQSEEDVANWFSKHISLLDPKHADTHRTVAVSLNGGSVLLHFSSPERKSHRMFRVTMTRFDSPAPETPLYRALKGCAKINPRGWWSFPIAFEDWSFLVARLAYLTIADRLQNNYTQEVLERAEVFLCEQLPRHFNGVTFHQLRLLNDSGVLDNKTPDAFVNMLFSLGEARGVTVNNIPLPSEGLDNSG